MSVLVQVLLHFALGRFGPSRNYECLRLQMVILNVTGEMVSCCTCLVPCSWQFSSFLGSGAWADLVCLEACDEHASCSSNSASGNAKWAAAISRRFSARRSAEVDVVERLQRWGDSQLRRPIGDTDLAALICCAVVATADDAADDLILAAAHAAVSAGVGDQCSAEI